MASKHKSRDAGRAAMPKRSSNVFPLSEKVCVCIGRSVVCIAFGPFLTLLIRQGPLYCQRHLLTAVHMTAIPAIEKNRVSKDFIKQLHLVMLFSLKTSSDFKQQNDYKP